MFAPLLKRIRARAGKKEQNNTMKNQVAANMKMVTIPFSTREAARLTDRKMEQADASWWRMREADIPHYGILARSTGKGIIEEGVTVFLIAGHNRDIFIGDKCKKFFVNEYVGLVDGTGWQSLVQLGRDVEMV